MTYKSEFATTKNLWWPERSLVPSACLSTACIAFFVLSICLTSTISEKKYTRFVLSRVLFLFISIRMQSPTAITIGYLLVVVASSVQAVANILLCCFLNVLTSAVYEQQLLPQV
jgi:hypothetical protein